MSELSTHLYSVKISVTYKHHNAEAIVTEAII